MGYGVWESMGYRSGISANEVGKFEILWGTREYGVREVWDRRESTVPRSLDAAGH
jgi:hypothetical protein